MLRNMIIVKVKKFGFGWSIHHEMAVDNTSGVPTDNPAPPPQAQYG